MQAFQIRMLAFALLVVAAACQIAFAGTAYDNPTLLTIESAPQKPIATYSFNQLKGDFAQQTLETHTPWTQEAPKTRFRGPYLKDILAKNGLDKEKNHRGSSL